jgi:hypothetical protein
MTKTKQNMTTAPTFQVIAIIGGSMESMVLFETSDETEACEVAEKYLRNPRRVPNQRDYCGGGVDAIFVEPVPVKQ